MNNKKTILLILFLVLASMLNAQQRPSIYDMGSQLQSYFPVSSEAAALFHRVEDEIDYPRGRVNIRIPLYTIETSSFTIPISLCYTTGGIRARQPNGHISLGWTIQAEPMITREVRGLRDEQYYMRDKNYKETNPELFNAQVVEGTKDDLADFFHYRTLASSGKFRMKMANGSFFDPELLSREYVKLQVPGNIVGSYFDNEIQLTDCSGTVYKYGSTSNAREVTRQASGIRTTTSWKASSITSVTGEAVTFNYKEYNYGEEHNTSYDYYATIGSYTNGWYNIASYWKGVSNYENCYNLNSGSWMYADSGRPYGSMNIRIDTRPVSQINFPEGSIRFTYDDTSKTLSTVGIHTSTGELIKRFRLVKTNIAHSRTLLSEVVIEDRLTNSQGKYLFSYHTPNGEHNYHPLTKAVDYMGYYNGQTSNTDWIERQTITHGNNNSKTLTIGGAVRDADPEHTKWFSLLSVKYPTGGRTAYQYEGNEIVYNGRYNTPADFYYSGGLRVARITDYPVTGKEVVRKFTYSPHGRIGAGHMRYPLYPVFYIQKLNTLNVYPNSFGGVGSSFTANDYVLYTSTNILGCTDDATYYEKVVEESGDMKTVYENDKLLYSSVATSYMNPSQYEESYYEPYWNNDYLSTCYTLKYYKGDVLLKEVTDIKFSLTSYDISLKKTARILNTYGPGAMSDMGVRGMFASAYRFRTQILNLTEEFPIRKHVVSYTPQGELAEETRNTYSYGTGTYKKYRQLTRREQTTAGGDTYRIDYKYPYDVPTPEVMKTKNAVSTPVEVHYFKNDILSKVVKFVYQANSSATAGFVLKKICESKNAACTEFDDVEVYSAWLPSGKPLLVTRRDGTNVCLLWSYKSQRVVAVIENTTLATVNTALSSLSLTTTSLASTSSPNYTSLENLQGILPGTRVTVYQHAPLRGLSRITGPDARKTGFEFDSMGRLQRIKDTNSNIQKEYEYNVSYK